MKLYQLTSKITSFFITKKCVAVINKKVVELNNSVPLCSKKCEKDFHMSIYSITFTHMI